MKILFFLLITQSVFSKTLTLEEYRSQVFENDPKTRAVKLQYEAYKNTVEEAEFMTGIHLISQLSHMDDQRVTVNPSFQGDRTVADTFSFGLQQQTTFGLKWALTQNIQKIDIENANIVSMPKYVDTYPKIELSMPLWRNWIGRETVGEKNQLRQQAELQKLKAEVDWINQQNEVELSYHRMASHLEAYQIQLDSLARAQKILNWSESRFKRNLIDEGDLVQAQAAVRAREIDVLNAKVDLENVARQFNLMRGVESDELKDSLKSQEVPLSELNVKLDEGKRRIDYEIQQKQIEQLESLSKAQAEKMKPSLDLQMQAWTQGRAVTYSASANRTFQDEDYLFVGLNFSMPLDQFKASRVREGYQNLIKSQSLLEESRRQQMTANWKETVERAAQIKSQIEILRDLEKLQRKKADAERDKLNRGRSTTFQVLSFEQDYFTARNRRIVAELEARQFIYSLDLFR